MTHGFPLGAFRRLGCLAMILQGRRSSPMGSTRWVSSAAPVWAHIISLRRGATFELPPPIIRVPALALTLHETGAREEESFA